MTITVFPMQWSWRFALLLLGAVGAIALVAAGLELAGAVEPGTLIKDASQTERIVAAVFGCAVQPFVWSTWKHSKLTLDAEALTCLRFGFVSRSETIRLADIKRWGTGKESNRGYRHRVLLLEYHDRSVRSIKLQMFSRQAEFLRAFEERLGPAAEVLSKVGGVVFTED